MTFETIDNILKDPALQAALLSRYWSQQEAELILLALGRSGLSPRRFAQCAGIGYRRLYDRLRRMQGAQQTATAGEAPGRQAAAAPAMAERLLEPQIVPLSVSDIPASAASAQSRPLGLKIRFYRPTPESAEQLVLELEVPLW